MARFRQEKNLNTYDFSTGGTGDNVIRIDDSKHPSAAGYYFEVAASSSLGSGTVSIRRRGTTTDDVTVSITSSSIARFQGTFTPPSGITEYVIFTDAATTRVRAARVIVDETGSQITGTETQIEIGNRELAKTNTTLSPLTGPKYWYFDSSVWDEGIQVVGEAVYRNTGSSMWTVTIKIQEDNGSFSGWTDVATIVSGGTASTATLVRSGTFTPTNDRNYRLASQISSSMGTYDIINGKIIIVQSQGKDISQETDTNHINGIFGGTGASGEAAQERSQSFTAESSPITAVDLKLWKSGSPTDNFVVKITATRGGSAMGTSTVAASSIVAGQVRNFLFSSPIAVTPGTTYYIEASRSGARDTTNYISLFMALNTDPYAGGFIHIKNNNVWQNDCLTCDYWFNVYAGALSKLEPQYLLGNTIKTSTGDYDCLSRFDPLEWVDVSVTWFHEANSIASGLSDIKVRDRTTPGDVSNSQIVDVTERDRSLELEMPGSAKDLDGNINQFITGRPIHGNRILAQITLTGNNLGWTPEPGIWHLQNPKVPVAYGQMPGGEQA